MQHPPHLHSKHRRPSQAAKFSDRVHRAFLPKRLEHVTGIPVRLRPRPHGRPKNIIIFMYNLTAKKMKNITAAYYQLLRNIAC